MSEEKMRIVEKVQKLLRLAKSSNKHEAELAAQRASELMEKHQIDAADTELADVKSGADSVVREHYMVEGQKMKLLWIETLAVACAKLFDGMVLINKHQLHGTSFTFVGFKSDIPMMKSLFEHLYGAWAGIVEADLKAEKLAWRQRAGEFAHWAPANTMKYKAGHGLGYANALVSRCCALAEERKAKVSAASNTCSALVLVRGDAIIKWKQENGITSVKRQASSGSAAGQNAGYRAGQRVPLGGALK
jgi:hypothetical protein